MRRLAAALFFAFTLHAQTPYLVHDVNTIRSASPVPSMPHSFFRYGSRVVFMTMVPAGLWSTDGTAAGTSQLASFTGSGFGGSSPGAFAVVNGTLIFNGRDSRGSELWMSDGTAAGTRLLADIANGSASSLPGDRIVYRGKLLFSARENVYGQELWITDGTPAGTRHFKDLVPGSEGSDPSSFVILNDILYFAAGGALWKSDGTEAGTVVVKPGVSASDLVVAGSRIFFHAYSEAHGREPWVSDGTEAGTFMLADIAPGGETSSYSAMHAFGNRVLFEASDRQHGTEPWISDGTAAGTRMLRDIRPGSDSSMVAMSAAVLGGTAYFGAGDAVTGIELWKTDGTAAGTMLVRDLLPGSTGSSPVGFITMGDRIYFVASLAGSSFALWVTDGTAEGTRPVQSEPRAAVGGFGPLLTDTGGTLYFAAANRLNGEEPWKSDGTDAGTAMVANLARDGAPSSSPRDLTAAGDWIYFTAWDGTSGSPDTTDTRGLWRSDGTAEGTVKLTEGASAPFLSAGRSLFFNKQHALWITDGTPEGTRAAAAILARFPRHQSVSLVFAQGDTVYGVSRDGTYVTRLDANAPATLIDEESAFSFTEMAGRVLFFADRDTVPGTLLRATDGTAEGTYTIAEIPGTISGHSAVMDGHLYFAASGNAPALWKSDGTPEGTVVVKSLPAAGLVAAGKRLFFRSGTNLWVTDGTDAGTRMLPATVREEMVAVGDRVVLVGEDAASGAEPWTSDGTPEGTRRLRDIYPGTPSSNPDELLAAGGAVYFVASDNLAGRELWVTDGTPEGTRLAGDVQPGTLGSFPRLLARAGERVFFAAETTATGAEVWALPLPVGPRITVADARAAEGSAARFRVALSSPSTTGVTVQWASSDGTAQSGSDYDAASGTLTFAPGETVRQIDVASRNDAATERNETFFLTLRDASGAVLEDSSAFAVIEDDDRSADLSLALDFSANRNVVVNATNRGPVAATNLRRVTTVTPSTHCALCGALPVQVAPGETARVDRHDSFAGEQRYYTVTVTAREHDANPGDNRVAWTARGNLSMDALHLTPGASANVWVSGPLPSPQLTIESSNPAVVSVPASVTAADIARPASFTARGLSTGTATIRVFSGSSTLGTLDVDVLAPGATRRWPGGVDVFVENTVRPYEQSHKVTIRAASAAPFTGQSATGVVTIATAEGRELARATLTPDRRLVELSIHLPEVGVNTIVSTYSGDAVFLPSTQTQSVHSTRGNVTIFATAERGGSMVRVRAQLEGSPMAAPTGRITVAAPGIAPQEAQLTTTAAGDAAEAEIVFSNVPAGEHTFLLTYSGDARYVPANQSVRLLNGKRRAARP